ncbi:7675_t:CDS:2 [Ambispora gerdemannii]|uniref:7675_t:CDS:1 n=1 Tax=Ambispora gerdemannii TaxID=144530 RepID=A0A9N8YQV8_9GLOM|nr:7675_t:CDS:2 [Ambispora gerdemannii]
MNNKRDIDNNNHESQFRPWNLENLIEFSEDSYELETTTKDSQPKNNNDSEINEIDQRFRLRNYKNFIELIEQQGSENIKDKFETKLRPWNYKNLANKGVKLARPILTKFETRKSTGELVLSDVSNIDYNDAIEGWRYGYVPNHNPRKGIMMSVACHPYKGKIVRIDGCTLADKHIDIEKLMRFEEFLNEEFMNAMVTDALEHVF